MRTIIGNPVWRGNRARGPNRADYARRMVHAPLPGRWLVGFGALVGALTTVTYLSLITAEGDNEVAVVVAWAAAMTVPCILALLAAFAGRTAPWLALTATVLFAGLGLLAILSIGIGFVAAAFLTGVGAAASARPAQRGPTPHPPAM